VVSRAERHPGRRPTAGSVLCACREREGELSENNIAIVQVLRCSVAKDDRVELTNNGRHADLDNRSDVEARGERAAFDASPHRISERFPVLLR
jgi:hypothetical protein